MTEKSYNFYAYLNRMKYIGRWGLMRSTEPETIEGHSFQTAWLTHALALIGNRYFDMDYNADRAAAAALYHDCSEIITGDLPTPVKYYNPEIKTAYKKLERTAEEKLLSMLPEELAEDYKPFISGTDQAEHTLIKAADKLSAYIKCIEELKAGNREFKRAAESTLEAIHALNSREAEYFLLNFIPPLTLTLDELS